MTTTSEVIRARERHHKALEALAKSIDPKSTADGLNLWRRLNRVERMARKASEDYCNGVIGIADMDYKAALAEAQVINIFGGLPKGFHVNRDPRGYALKLSSNDNGTEAATPFALEQDWGRNQILAPTIE